LVSVSSDVSTVDGVSEGVPGVSHLQTYRQTTKIRDLFEIVNDTFSKFYNLSENMAIDEVIVPYKGRVIFKQYIPTKRSFSASKFSKFVTRQDTHMT
jgi:hypothetical protein